jgi:tRNA (guanosine-2'-O-)-methyltransferase
VEQLRAARLTICAAHASSDAKDYRSMDYTKPTAILVGAELAGVSLRAIELSDEHIAIPMYGMVHSLNVSVATAIILFEAQRQRARAGMYDARRLPPEEYARILFEWLHPEVARWCRERGLPYPAVDERGDIVDFPARAGGGPPA